MYRPKVNGDMFLTCFVCVLHFSTSYLLHPPLTQVLLLIPDLPVQRRSLSFSFIFLNPSSNLTFISFIRLREPEYIMSPKKDVNKVAKTPSKRKATQSPTPIGSSTPKERGYGPVDDAELLWAVLYQAADAPKVSSTHNPNIEFPCPIYVGRLCNV